MCVAKLIHEIEKESDNAVILGTTVLEAEFCGIA